MYCSMLYYSTLILLDFYLVSVGIVVCPVCRGYVKDPKTLLFCVMFLLISLNN